MAGLEGLRVGNAAAVSREALIARLERTAAAGVFQWEGNRRARLVEALDLARRQLAAQHVRIPAAVDVRERIRTRSLADPGTIEDVPAVENDVVPFDRADVLGAGLRPGLPW